MKTHFAAAAAVLVLARLAIQWDGLLVAAGLAILAAFVCLVADTWRRGGRPTNAGKASFETPTRGR